MLKLPRLRSGDRVRLVSPASTPSREGVERTIAVLEGFGLKVEVGQHVLDVHGYLAGRDEDRLSDFNDALRDPGVRAAIATRGGRGAYRITDGLDFAALRADPKPIVGFSEITILHLAAQLHAGVPGIHGACWDESVGQVSAASIRDVLMERAPTTVRATPEEPTASLTTAGRASGVLLGGNLDMIVTAAGWTLPDLNDAILLIEAVQMGLGQLDRSLTRLIKAGALSGLRGIAIGQFTGIKASHGWDAIDVLRDRLAPLGIPMLGGLPLGHGAGPMAVPVGTAADLDADGGTLTVASPFE